ncbi:MAG: hypothetical protein K2V38_10665, partial [Gemmataceae bacterium]|nr:hypothetical protein [Gemmataceae bacterium]
REVCPRLHEITVLRGQSNQAGQAMAVLESQRQQKLVVRAERESAAIRAAADRECEAVRARAEAEQAAVQQATTRELAPLVRGLLEQLRTLQQHCTREGLLDEALAIRSRVRQLRGDLLGVRPDPGTLTEFTPTDAGRTILLEVTGRTDGSIWGTDVYTADSRVATAAVHAGLVRVGEKAILRATVLNGADLVYTGSFRHDVESNDYGPYPMAYRLEKV